MLLFSTMHVGVSLCSSSIQHERIVWRLYGVSVIIIGLLFPSNITLAIIIWSYSIYALVCLDSSFTASLLAGTREELEMRTTMPTEWWRRYMIDTCQLSIDN